MFSYSTEYYVPPPVDQYLKFKNRCSLVCILHFLKKSQIRCTLLHRARDVWGYFPHLWLHTKLCKADVGNRNARFSWMYPNDIYAQCSKFYPEKWRKCILYIVNLYNMYNCTIVFWRYKEWKRGRIKYMWKSRSREKRRLYEKTTRRPAPETRYIYESSKISLYNYTISIHDSNAINIHPSPSTRKYYK